jgi:replicative DNA helicase
MKLPTNPDAESALVSSLLSGMAPPADAADVYGRVTPDALSSPNLSVVYEATRHLFLGSGQNPAASMVIERLRSTNKLEAAGGKEAVTQLDELAVTGANVCTWAGIVEDYYKRRLLIRAAAESATRAADASVPFADVTDYMGGRLTEISSGREDLTVLELADVMKAEFRAIDAAYHSTADDHEVKTGFRDLDEVMGGLVRSELTVLAGRPGMGKTSLALAFAMNASRAQRRVLFFSLEMSRRQVSHRLIAMTSGVSTQELRRPKLMRDSSWTHLAHAMSALHNSKLVIVDAPSLSVMDIRSVARTCRAKHGLDLVAVDYLQLIKPAEKSHSREREVAVISANLKSISRELDVPVLCMAQLNRVNESQTDKVPRLSNLRESGAIEQDSDCVLFVHRAHYYATKDKDGDPVDPTFAEIYVAKNRNGPCGRIEVGWEEGKTLFYDPKAKEDRP